MDFQHQLPMTLWLKGKYEAILQLKILRMIPKKRWVILAYWGDKQVVVKLFYKHQRAKQELQRAQTLHASGIKTPVLLHHGPLLNQPMYALIFEKLDSALVLDVAWRSSKEDQKTEIMNHLIAMTARLHALGFIQKDLHFNNFLICNSEIYAIDAGAIIKTSDGRSISERASLKNLALLFAQVSPGEQYNFEEGYALYAKMRDFIFTLDKFTDLQKWIAYWRKRHLSLYGRKVFRTTTHLLCNRSWRRYSMVDRSYASEALMAKLAEPEILMNDVNSKILKAGDTCTVVQVEIEGRLLVIKRYNLKNFGYAFLRAFRRTRASICWRSAMYLTFWQLGVVKPVALIEERFGPFRRKAYFVTEYEPGINLQEYFFERPYLKDQMEMIAQKIFQLLGTLSKVKISHGDLKATNILLVGDRPVLLDLDAMRVHRFTWKWKKAQQRDQKRFMKNWVGFPELEKLFQNAMNL